MQESTTDRIELGLGLLWKNFRGRILLTWFLVLLENAAMALIPLFIGWTIDDLLEGSGLSVVVPLATVLVVLTVVGVARRVYDTRAYGTMRVFLGGQVVERQQERPISKLDARLDMAREFVDFLEAYVPALLTSTVQLLVSFVILLRFDLSLGLSAGILIVIMLAVYAVFHPAIFRANRNLNEQLEQQVGVLEERKIPSLTSHLSSLRRFEVRMSDIDAGMYGLLFLFMAAFIVTNLVLASRLEVVTAGVIFSIVAYSWEFVESGSTLPATLQQWTRLGEIKTRLNENAD